MFVLWSPNWSSDYFIITQIYFYTLKKCLIIVATGYYGANWFWNNTNIWFVIQVNNWILYWMPVLLPFID